MPIYQLSLLCPRQNKTKMQGGEDRVCPEVHAHIHVWRMMLLRGVLMFQHLRFKFCSRNRKLRRRSHVYLSQVVLGLTWLRLTETYSLGLFLQELHWKHGALVKWRMPQIFAFLKLFVQLQTNFKPMVLIVNFMLNRIPWILDLSPQSQATASFSASRAQETSMTSRIYVPLIIIPVDALVEKVCC